MTFIINSIKEGFNKKYNVEFVLGVDSPLLARKIMEDIGIIVLSLKEYKETKVNFGNIQLKFPYLQQEIPITAKYDGTLAEACSFFLMLGFPITYINLIDKPISDDEAKKIIQNSILENERIKESQKIEIKQKEVAERKVYDDPHLQVDKEIIERTSNRTEKIIEMCKGLISGKDLKSLKDKEDELKKLKLGTNHARIKELVQEMINMLDIIQNEYYETNKDQAKPISQESVATDFDIIRGLDTEEKVSKLQKIGGKIKSNEQDYITLKKYAIYPRILFKDLSYIFTSPSHITNIVYNAYDLREIALAFILIQSSVWMLLNTLYLRSDDTSYNYFYSLFIKIGLIGLLSRGARYLRRKNLAILITLIQAIVILYYILITIINNNFSL